jgi:hypothetical protein
MSHRQQLQCLRPWWTGNQRSLKFRQQVSAWTARPSLESLEDRLAMSGHPLTSIPVLHSNPDAPVHIYLKFDGYLDKGWWGQTGAPDRTGTLVDQAGHPYTVNYNHNDSFQPIFDMDGDITTFSDQELQTIHDIWQRVADDYAPFNVDVTTAAVGDLSAGKGVVAAIKYASDGGVAQLGAFNNAGSSRSVYASGQSAAEAATITSQEVAHVFGLNHQLYEGTPLERAIMYPYTDGPNTRRSVWVKGLIDNKGDTQDDVAKLTSVLGLRPDDFGDSMAQAAPLLPNGYEQSRDGVIGQTSDVDFFSVQVGAGAYVVHVDPVENLKAKVQLFDAQGHLLATADPGWATSAVVTQNLPAGKYFIAVSGHGDYEDIGQYTVGVAPAGPRVVASDPHPDHVRLTFDTPVDPVSVNWGQVGVYDRAHHLLPGIRTTVVAGSNNQTWEVDFSPSAQGGYRLEVGPYIRDRWGNAMDQNGNGVFGEPVTDKFVLEDFTAPTVQGVGAAIPFDSSTQNIVVSFSEAIDLDSLRANLTLSGGAVVLGISEAPALDLPTGSSGRSYYIRVSAPPGTYTVTLGTGITDLFGNHLQAPSTSQVKLDWPEVHVAPHGPFANMDPRVATLAPGPSQHPWAPDPPPDPWLDVPLADASPLNSIWMSGAAMM